MEIIYIYVSNMEQGTFHNTMAMLETSMPILGIFHGKLLVITRLGSHH